MILKKVLDVSLTSHKHHLKKTNKNKKLNRTVSDIFLLFSTTTPTDITPHPSGRVQSYGSILTDNDSSLCNTFLLYLDVDLKTQKLKKDNKEIRRNKEDKQSI